MVLVYAGIVVAFESLLGYYQPSSQGTVVITTDAEHDPTPTLDQPDARNIGSRLNE